jgi:hypothetical protein
MEGMIDPLDMMIIKHQSGIDDEDTIVQAYEKNNGDIVSTIADIMGLDTPSNVVTTTTTVTSDDDDANTRADLRELREILREKDAMFFDQLHQHQQQQSSGTVDGGAQAQLECAQAGDRVDTD